MKLKNYFHLQKLISMNYNIKYSEIFMLQNVMGTKKFNLYWKTLKIKYKVKFIHKQTLSYNKS